ncbi:MAG: SAM-dependent chlorinase/fluorinase [Acidimicrobiales bacterium]
MTLRYDTVTFCSDYGRTDEFVGIVHSVIRSIAPGVAIIDLTHDIARQDVRAGGLLLGRSAQYLNPGVVLAVVDPGVGGTRRPVAVEVGGGQSVLVGPDNGLLAPAVAMCGGASTAVVLDNPDYQMPAPGATFAGRDVFAPAAGYLCAGVPLRQLGTEIDPAVLMPAMVPIPRREDDALVCEVLWVDTYGNAQLNLDPSELPDGEVLIVATAERSRRARRVDAYVELGPGELGLVTDSYGLVSLAMDQRSAAAELGVGEAAEVTVRVDDGDDDDGAGGPGGGAVSAVQLGPTRRP